MILLRLIIGKEACDTEKSLQGGYNISVIREATKKDQKEYDEVARHPLQSWQWGEFREKTGVEVSRLIQSDGKKIKEVYQITWHKVPRINRWIGYCPKSAIPDAEVLEAMIEKAKSKKAMFIKFEPNERAGDREQKRVASLGNQFDLVKGKPLFTRYSFQLDISKSEEELLKKMHPKTRYNLRLAEKRGVKVVEDDSEKDFEEYWRLTEETTKRQGFFAHTKKYHQQIWQTMVLSGTGHLFKAVFQDEVLTTWIVFELNGVWYYPYGASSHKHREVMASNLMMWEVIKFAKKQGGRMFDLWGSLGPEPKTSDPWYGFHRFKQGYGAELVEFVGSYDLVINRREYRVYTLAEKLRWIWLKFIAKLRK